MSTLQNKVVLITGASGGLGAHLAMDVAKKGATPILTARREDQLKVVQEAILKATNVTAPYYILDVSNTDSVEEVFSTILSEHQNIHILVNNAGYGIFEEFVDSPWKNIEGMFSTNVLGLMACTRAVLPHMLQRGNGHIVNIASQAGKISTPKSSVYAATKHAVLGFSNGLRLEVAHKGVDVTTINPGPIATNFFTLADQSGNYVKNVQKLMLQPSHVSDKIVKAMERPVREINLPWWMNVGSTMYQVMPKLIETLGGKSFRQK
ncbi:SDR family oxidoreductase [Fictibacillus sp. 23RED33]|uniref:SDR family NAD(P)-dependent oxidoreductase n=1 Tax=Fictibacillus sp. 23RED33 TaxID=2745879 RepID=UPI0018CF56EB|nr:SDR family oxidoreductase [Fictibacillus sp. 23RED33]MBH0174491.1 SDR family oxidoreductase [Fictibacillus sp. 23RED33]